MTQEDRARPPWVEQFTHDARSIGAWLLERSSWVIVTGLVFLSLIRNGIAIWNWFELSPFLLTDWSAPVSAFQANVILNAIATGWLNIGLDPTSLLWQLTQVAVTLVSFAVLSALVLKRSKNTSGYLPLALILSSGLAAVLWREIGRYDALFLIGIAIAVLAARPALAWLGVALAVGSSPEQAIVAAVLLVLLACLPTFQQWLKSGLRLLIGSVVGIVVVQAWFAVAGDPFKTRIGVLLQHMVGEPIQAASAYDTKQSFVQFTIEKAMVSFSAGPGLVWSILGMTVLVVIFVLIVQRNWWQGIYLLVVTMLIPVIISFVFGEDRTRDSALVSAAVIIAIAITGSERIAEVLTRVLGDPRMWLVWASLIVAIIPMTYFYLDAEESWRWVKEVLVALNNGVSIPNDGSAR